MIEHGGGLNFSKFARGALFFLGRGAGQKGKTSFEK